MAALNEGKHRGEFLHSEANRTISREQVTVAQSVVLSAGTVMGMVTATSKYKILAPAATDGTQNASAILFDNVDASVADSLATIIARQAEVNGSEIVWPAGITAPQIATATAALAANGIRIR